MIVILAEKEQEEQISGHEGRRRKAGQKGEGEGMEGRRALGSGEVEAPCEIGPYVFLAKFPKMIGRFPPLVWDYMEEKWREGLEEIGAERKASSLVEQ